VALEAEARKEGTGFGPMRTRFLLGIGVKTTRQPRKTEIFAGAKLIEREGQIMSTNNVIDIETRSARTPEAVPKEGGQSAEEQGVSTSAPAGATPSKVGALLWSLVRVPLFLVLYWLRLPVMLVCRLISVPALLAFLFSLYAFPDKHTMVTGFGVLSFGAFVALWLYDTLLLWLSPHDMMRTL